MADTFELSLDATDPYIRTRLYTLAGRAFFGIWNPPPVAVQGDEEIITVREGEEGQLDSFAFGVYGDRRLWRVIAHANQIDFVYRQVVPGLRLIIPKPTLVFAALQQSARQGGQ
jgi:hypothetical protein